MTVDKVNVLILGGVGFIGRHFVHYLLKNNLVGDIRVVDKALPQTAYLSEEFKADFSRVEFKQSNLVNPGKIYTFCSEFVIEILFYISLYYGLF